MKKTYVKPEMLYEDFELSHHIASCSPNINHDAKEENCGYKDENLGISLFTGAVNCRDDIGIFADYCYQTGTDKFNFFTS